MSNALTTDRVSIERATVELQVIRVGGKQMTQAVFDQLPVETLEYLADVTWLEGTQSPRMYSLKPRGVVQFWGWISRPGPFKHTRQQWLIAVTARNRLVRCLNTYDLAEIEDLELPQLFIAI